MFVASSEEIYRVFYAKGHGLDSLDTVGKLTIASLASFT